MLFVGRFFNSSDLFDENKKKGGVMAGVLYKKIVYLHEYR